MSDLLRRSVLAGLSALAPLPALARSTDFIGSPPGVSRRPSSYAPASYAPQAVHFDGATWFRNAALSCTDNGKFSCSAWLRLDGPYPAATFMTLWISNPSLYISYAALRNFGTPLTAVYELGSDDGNSFFALGFADDFDDGAAWYHLMYSADAQSPQGSRKEKLYVNGVDVTAPFGIDAGGAFTPTMNGLPFVVGGDTFAGDGFVGKAADWRFEPGRSYLDGGGDISLATRRLFRTDAGLPVDPAVATAALGAPATLFSASAGDAASFSTNRGTGGAFTLTGTLTLASGP